jgi:hypothetical protein
MNKNITAFCFILLANIILLVHAVMPHHHHGQVFCVQHTPCTHDVATNDSHCTSEQNHKPNGTNSTPCALKQAVFIHTSQFRFSGVYNNSSDNQIHDYYIGSVYDCESLRPIEVSVKTYHRFALFLTTVLPSTFGLRAPPAV